MKLLIAVVIAVFISAIGIIAQGTIVIPYTPDQLVGVTWARDAHNAEDLASNDGNDQLTVSEYGIRHCQLTWDSYVIQRANERILLEDNITKYQSLTDAERQQVDDLLDTLSTN